MCENIESRLVVVGKLFCCLLQHSDWFLSPTPRPFGNGPWTFYIVGKHVISFSFF